MPKARVRILGSVGRAIQTGGTIIKELGSGEITLAQLKEALGLSGLGAPGQTGQPARPVVTTTAEPAAGRTSTQTPAVHIPSMRRPAAMRGTIDSLLEGNDFWRTPSSHFDNLANRNWNLGKTIDDSGSLRYAVSYVDGNRRALVDLASAHLNKNLSNIADDAGSSRYAVLAVDGNRRALIDLSSGHLNVNRATTYAMQCPTVAPAVITQAVTPASLSSSANWYQFTGKGIILPGAVEWDVDLASGGICDILFNRSNVFGQGYIMRLDGRAGVPIGQILLANVSGPSWADIGTYFVGNNAAALGGTHHLRAIFGSNGYMELWVDGVLATAARDTTFTPNGSCYGGIEVVGPSSTVSAPTAITVQAVAGAAGHVSPIGSFQPFTSGGSFTYTSTTTSISISWPSQTIYLPSGGTLTVGSGSTTVSGLTASTTYHFYPYIDIANAAMAFAGGGVGTNGYAFTASSAAASAVGAQAQYLPMPPFTAATPASGSGGGGGGGGCCLHGEQPIELVDGSVVRAHQLEVGMTLDSPDGGTRIVKMSKEPWRQWFKVTLSDGTELLVAADHRFVDPTGEQIHTRDARLQHIVQGRQRYLEIVKMEIVREPGVKVSVEVQEPHTYYVCGTLAHNKQLC